MTSHPRPLRLLAAALLLAGCAATPARPATIAGTVSAAAIAAAPQSPASAGPASTAPPAKALPTAAPANPKPRNAAPATPSLGAKQEKPTAAALMVCGDDIKGKVKQVLALPTAPRVTSTFSNQIYTCTYHLPVGPMLLSVQHSPTKSSAQQYFSTLRRHLPPTRPLIGLGDGAYATTTGVAVVIKDNETLTVDTTKLPAIFGTNQQHRTDLANEIASDVLGCWTGDE